MDKSKNIAKVCGTCEHICPFFEGDIGNCDIDMKEVNRLFDTCENYKLQKDREKWAI